MVVSNKPLKYFTDDRDGSYKEGIIMIKAVNYTRQLENKEYVIDIVDYVDGSVIKVKTLKKSYAEVDGLRKMLLNTGKDYSAFKDSALEDELLNDVMLLIIRSEKHYNSTPGDWELYTPPVIEEKIIEPVIDTPQPTVIEPVIVTPIDRGVQNIPTQPKP